MGADENAETKSKSVETSFDGIVLEELPGNIRIVELTDGQLALIVPGPREPLDSD
jgi:hypothetical protein